MQRYIIRSAYAEIVLTLMEEQGVIPRLWNHGVKGSAVIVQQSMSATYEYPRDMIVWISDAIGCGLVSSYQVEDVEIYE